MCTEAVSVELLDWAVMEVCLHVCMHAGIGKVGTRVSPAMGSG